MPDIDNNQLAIGNLLTVNEFVFHALDCDKEKAYLNVIGRLAIGSRGYELVNKITNRIEIKNSGEELPSFFAASCRLCTNFVIILERSRKSYRLCFIRRGIQATNIIIYFIKKL